LFCTKKEFLSNWLLDLKFLLQNTKKFREPIKYPINPPYLNTQRIERLYDSSMVNIDHHLGDNQEVMLKKLCLV
jgi:hypothetical protein